jgi:DNA-binding NarL/FixJ family response regulator
LTVFDDNENIFNAIKAGADNYLLKEIMRTKLYQGIQDLVNVSAATHPVIASKILKLLRNPQVFKNKSALNFKVSSTEIEVLAQLSKGLS